MGGRTDQAAVTSIALYVGGVRITTETEYSGYLFTKHKHLVD